MKKALITGGKGFVGRNMISALSKRFPFEMETFDEEIFERNNWHDWIKLFLSKVRPSVVFHVGACSDTQEKDSQIMFERNFQVTKLLVDWCRLHNVPLIYSSSAASYGTNGMFPSNLYGWSKYVAEQYVASNWGISLRYFNVFGPGEEDKGKMASIFFQAHSLKKRGKEIGIFPGKPRRDFVFIDEIIHANLYAFEMYTKFNCKVFEVGTGVAHSFEEGLEHLGFTYFYLPQSQIPTGYQSQTQANSKNFLPGWAPSIGFFEGLTRYDKYLNSPSIQ
jgi:ADP-L-glycero-D-manno-heptose 6-epimerase